MHMLKAYNIICTNASMCVRVCMCVCVCVCTYVRMCVCAWIISGYKYVLIAIVNLYTDTVKMSVRRSADCNNIENESTGSCCDDRDGRDGLPGHDGLTGRDGKVNQD